MSYHRFVSFEKAYEARDRDNSRGLPENTLWRHFLRCGGRITVLHRLTGYGHDVWDTETAYRSPCGQFWLASGDWDIRDHLAEFDSEEGMIAWVMDRANNCTGGNHGSWRTATTAAALGLTP